MSEFLVIGGTGKTGRRVVRQLEKRGHAARAASRSSAATPFDWAAPDTYAPALRGVAAAYLTVPGQSDANAEEVGEFLDMAAGAGVERVVLLSARAVEFHPSGALAAVEEVVRRSGLAHSILRPSWFAENFTEAFLAPDANGAVSAPTGDGREPFIDLNDLAEVAVEALTTDRPSETIYLSGSETLSFGQAVAKLGDATGQRLTFEAADPLQYRALLAGKLPEPYIEWRMAMFDAIRERRDEYISGGVEDVLGRPAVGFSEWLGRSRS